MTAIQYAKGDKQRLAPYKDLLKVTQKTIGYAIKAGEMIGERCKANFELLGLLDALKHYGDLARQLYDQTYRRVIQGESVPADQKVFSIFENHTDIIIKDRRENHYGHKICLTGGASNLILDCVIPAIPPTADWLNRCWIARIRSTGAIRAQTQLRLDPLYLERISLIQKLCAFIGCRGQPADNRPKAIGCL
jgi:hypothetical protein